MNLKKRIESHYGLRVTPTESLFRISKRELKGVLKKALDEGATIEENLKKRIESLSLFTHAVAMRTPISNLKKRIERAS